MPNLVFVSAGLLFLIRSSEFCLALGTAGEIHSSMTGLLLRSYLSLWCVPMTMWECAPRATTDTHGHTGRDTRGMQELLDVMHKQIQSSEILSKREIKYSVHHFLLYAEMEVAEALYFQVPTVLGKLGFFNGSYQIRDLLFQDQAKMEDFHIITRIQSCILNAVIMETDNQAGLDLAEMQGSRLELKFPQIERLLCRIFI